MMWFESPCIKAEWGFNISLSTDINLNTALLSDIKKYLDCHLYHHKVSLGFIKGCCNKLIWKVLQGDVAIN